MRHGERVARQSVFPVNRTLFPPVLPTLKTPPFLVENQGATWGTTLGDSEVDDWTKKFLTGDPGKRMYESEEELVDVSFVPIVKDFLG